MCYNVICIYYILKSAGSLFRLYGGVYFGLGLRVFKL